MKQNFTFLLLTFLSFQLYSQCPTGISNLANGTRIFATYDNVVDLNTAVAAFGTDPMVTYNGNNYPIQAQQSNLRFRNNPAAPSNTFIDLNVGVKVLTFFGALSSITCTYNEGVLPVELLSFTAKSDKKATDKVLLKWATASELNNSHFTIEHSTDGKNFTAIDKVAGMGTYDDLTEYNFTHEKAQSGDNFYRLKQVDFDGTFAFSPIAQVSLASNQVSIKQTLVTDVLQVSFNAQNTTNIPYQIANARGQVLQSGILNTRNASQEISINELNDGIYFLHSVVNGELSVNKFVKF